MLPLPEDIFDSYHHLCLANEDIIDEPKIIFIYDPGGSNQLSPPPTAYTTTGFPRCICFSVFLLIALLVHAVERSLLICLKC